MSAFDYVALVLRSTPLWAFAVLGLLVFLGVRRLKARIGSLGSAFIAPTAFFLWGLFNVQAYGAAQSVLLAWSIFGSMVGLGWLSWSLRPSDTARLEPDGRYLFPGTAEPLVTYLIVFFIRFGLEVWAGFVPSAEPVAGGLAIGLSACIAGRTAARAWALLAMKRATSTTTAV